MRIGGRKSKLWKNTSLNNINKAYLCLRCLKDKSIKDNLIIKYNEDEF